MMCAASTVLIICCSPEEEQAPETLSTLKFGECAKRVTTFASANVVAAPDEVGAQLAQLRDEVVRLKRQVCVFRAVFVCCAAVVVAGWMIPLPLLPLPLPASPWGCWDRVVFFFSRSTLQLFSALKYKLALAAPSGVLGGFACSKVDQ